MGAEVITCAFFNIFHIVDGGEAAVEHSALERSRCKIIHRAGSVAHMEAVTQISAGLHQFGCNSIDFCAHGIEALHYAVAIDGAIVIEVEFQLTHLYLVLLEILLHKSVFAHSELEGKWRQCGLQCVDVERYFLPLIHSHFFALLYLLHKSFHSHFGAEIYRQIFVVQACIDGAVAALKCQCHTRRTEADGIVLHLYRLHFGYYITFHSGKVDIAECLQRSASAKRHIAEAQFVQIQVAHIAIHSHHIVVGLQLAATLQRKVAVFVLRVDRCIKLSVVKVHIAHHISIIGVAVTQVVYIDCGIEHGIRFHYVEPASTHLQAGGHVAECAQRH